MSRTTELLFFKPLLMYQSFFVCTSRELCKQLELTLQHGAKDRDSSLGLAVIRYEKLVPYRYLIKYISG
jgi:hypothetical protein